MRCPQCGMGVRPDATECPECGADLRGSAGSSFAAYQPTQGYVPGGGPSKASGPPARRSGPGPLSARLQRSQASMPGADGFDDEEEEVGPEPPRGSRSRPLRSSDGMPPQQVRRARAQSDGPQRGDYPPSARRGADGDWLWDEEPPSAERPAYTAGPRSRSYPSPGRAPDADYRDSPSPRAPYPGAQREGADEYAESWAPQEEGYRGRPSGGRRRSRPLDAPPCGWGDEYLNPVDDPRAPPELRRPAAGGPRRRAPEMYGEAARRGDPYARGPEYGRSGGYDGASAEYAAYPDSPDYPPYDEYGRGGEGAQPVRDYSRSRSRPRRSAPRAGYEAHERAEYAPYAPYAPYDAYDGQREPDAGYGEYGEGWDEGPVYSGHPGERGAGLPARYDDADAWRPGAPATSASRGTKGAAPRRRGAGLRVALFLMALLIGTAAAGVKFGPAVYRKYTHQAVGATPQPTTSALCARQATPPAGAKPPAGSTMFATSAYTLLYPSSWQESEQVGTLGGKCDVVYAFTAANGPAKFTVEQAALFAQQTNQQVLTAEEQAAQSQGYTLKEITSAATTQGIGGEVWDRREYGVTAKDGSKFHLAVLVGRHGGAAYAILLLDGDTLFARDDTTIFEPALRSVTFTS